MGANKLKSKIIPTNLYAKHLLLVYDTVEAQTEFEKL